MIESNREECHCLLLWKFGLWVDTKFRKCLLLYTRRKFTCNFVNFRFSATHGEVVWILSEEKSFQQLFGSAAANCKKN